MLDFTLDLRPEKFAGFGKLPVQFVSPKCLLGVLQLFEQKIGVGVGGEPFGNGLRLGFGKFAVEVGLQFKLGLEVNHAGFSLFQAAINAAILRRA